MLKPECEIKNFIFKASNIIMLLLTFSVLPVLPAHADSSADAYEVSIDQAKLLPLEKQSSAIIVGNPSIADVAVQNGKLLVVTGKSYGTTNLIVLDTERKVIVSKTITVIDNKQQVVQLYKGSMKQSYSCQPKCSSIMNIGDDAEFAKNVMTTTTNKATLVKGGSEQGQSSGQ